jgi:hypothetical protein
MRGRPSDFPESRPGFGDRSSSTAREACTSHHPSKYSIHLTRSTPPSQFELLSNTSAAFIPDP